MNYSAEELFQDWYSQSIKGDHTDSEISIRRESVNQILKNSNRDFWLDSVSIYYGLLSSGTETYELYVKECRQKDENFPLKSNQHIIRVLAGCALAQKIEQSGRSVLSDILNLALLTTNYLDRSKSTPLPEIIKLASKSYREECKLIREINPINEIAEVDKLATKELELDEVEEDTDASVEYVTIEDFNLNIIKIQTGFNGLLVDIKNFQGEQEEIPVAINELENKLNIISEETNIVWWLYGGFSRDFDLPFSKLGLPSLFVIAPKELSDLTIIKPGLRNVNAYLAKAFSISAKTVPEKISFLKLIESIEPHKEWLNEIVENFLTKYENLTPCLQALYLYNESAQSIEWQLSFKRKSKIAADTTVNSLAFSSQLYYELMLIKHLV